MITSGAFRNVVVYFGAIVLRAFGEFSMRDAVAEAKAIWQEISG